MKIYPDERLPLGLNLENVQKDYNFSKSIHNGFLTPRGMFVYERDKLYKLHTTDEPVQKVAIDGHTFLLDKSYYTKSAALHLSVDHVNIVTYKFTFHLDRSTAVIEGKMENGKYTPTDLYFTIKERNKTMTTDVAKDINKFLSRLK